MSAAAWSAVIAGLALVLSAIGFILGQVRQSKATEQQNRAEAKIQAARERAERAEATANDARNRAAEAQEKIAHLLARQAQLLARQGQVPERDLVMVRGKGSDEFELVNRGDKNYEGVTVFPQPDIQDLTKFPENIYVLAGDRSPGWRMRPKPGYQMPDHLMMWVANHGQIRIRIPAPPNP